MRFDFRVEFRVEYRVSKTEQFQIFPDVPECVCRASHAEPENEFVVAVYRPYSAPHP